MSKYHRIKLSDRFLEELVKQKICSEEEVIKIKNEEKRYERIEKLKQIELNKKK